jgi:hypothetical protein
VPLKQNYGTLEMADRTTKRLVIDASVARSCGSPAADKPPGNTCRDFLYAVLDCEHQVVMTTEIRAEWQKHQSRNTARWLRLMVSNGQLFPIQEPLFDAELWETIPDMAQSDKQREAMAKDILLLEAALATDRRIVSLDENTARKYYTLAAKTILKLREIVWVNPDKPEENPIEWLREGAPADDWRMLGRD